ncbi:MAG: acyl-CoA dehydrogenase family protein, partial [Bacteroidota bacterium]
MPDHQANGVKSAREDRFQGHDYYNIDALLSDDHLLARDAVRNWVKQEVSPIIEDYSNRAECPYHLFKGLAEIGAFGPSLPEE